MAKRTHPDKPLALWIDDSAAQGYPFVVELLQERIGTDFDLVLLGDTDEAVEFAVEHRDRLFMFIQDSTRPEGAVIPAWKRLRPVPGPAIGYRSHKGVFTHT